VLSARKLGHVGDGKFADSLVKHIKLAEKLYGKCGKTAACAPADAALDLLMKRLELANRKCDAKQARDCDEEPYWAAFRKERAADAAFKDFFREWDGSDWHKYKKTAKRALSGDALDIIKADCEALRAPKPVETVAVSTP